MLLPCAGTSDIRYRLSILAICYLLQTALCQRESGSNGNCYNHFPTKQCFCAPCCQDQSPLILVVTTNVLTNQISYPPPTQAIKIPYHFLYLLSNHSREPDERKIVKGNTRQANLYNGNTSPKRKNTFSPI